MWQVRLGAVMSREQTGEGEECGAWVWAAEMAG